jgi:hypothetical protein
MSGSQCRPCARPPASSGCSEPRPPRTSPPSMASKAPNSRLRPSSPTTPRRRRPPQSRPRDSPHHRRRRSAASTRPPSTSAPEGTDVLRCPCGRPSPHPRHALHPRRRFRPDSRSSASPCRLHAGDSRPPPPSPAFPSPSDTSASSSHRHHAGAPVHLGAPPTPDSVKTASSHLKPARLLPAGLVPPGPVSRVVPPLRRSTDCRTRWRPRCRARTTRAR